MSAYFAAGWPYLCVLACIVGAWLILGRFATKADKVVDAVVEGLTTNAQKNAMAVLLACALAISASIGAFIDNFGGIDSDAMHVLAWWQILALLAKCANPGIVAVIGLLMKSPLAATVAPVQPKSPTNPPFPTPAP